MLIRSAVPADAGEILKIYAPYVEKTAISFEYEVPTHEEFQSRVEGILANYPYLVAVEDGEIVGYSYASRFKPRKAYDHVAEVSIYIAEDHKGKGIGRALYEELEQQLVAKNVFVAYACITETERANDEYLTDDSINFHTKMGYRLVGRHELCGYKFGRWYSMIWMEKVLAPRPAHPEEFKADGGSK